MRTICKWGYTFGNATFGCTNDRRQYVCGCRLANNEGMHRHRYVWGSKSMHECGSIKCDLPEWTGDPGQMQNGHMSISASDNGDTRVMDTRNANEFEESHCNVHDNGTTTPVCKGNGNVDGESMTDTINGMQTDKEFPLLQLVNERLYNTSSVSSSSKIAHPAAKPVFQSQRPRFCKAESKCFGELGVAA